MSVRTEKIESLIKRILAKPINNLAQENNAGIVSVTQIKVSSDLQIAKVFVSVFNGKVLPDKFMTILENHKGMLKTEIAHNARLRYTPDLKFFLDDSLDKINRIQELLNESDKQLID